MGDISIIEPTEAARKHSLLFAVLAAEYALTAADEIARGAAYDDTDEILMLAEESISVSRADLGALIQITRGYDGEIEPTESY